METSMTEKTEDADKRGRPDARLKRGFTMIELIIVVGIIGILASITLALAPGFLASGRDTTCKANMRNLANAFQHAGGNFYPVAGSYQYAYVLLSDDEGMHSKVKYKACSMRGWISWKNTGGYPKTVNTFDTAPSAQHEYLNGGKTAFDCIEKGTLWKYTDHDFNKYLCPEFAREYDKEYKSGKYGPAWSYAMNAYFKFDATQGKGSSYDYDGRNGRKKVEESRTSKRLLFAEIQGLPKEQTGLPRTFDARDYRCDCTLQYKDCGEGWSSKCEIIGFNHEAGGVFHGNVVFCDGHVEEIELPETVSESNLKDLTQWLCLGYDYALENGRTYKKIQ